MDAKVNAMLKLVNEDADSFIRWAQMYYEKRPEISTLVEDFYKACSSLALWYQFEVQISHATPHTGELQHVQMTSAVLKDEKNGVNCSVPFDTDQIPELQPKANFFQDSWVANEELEREIPFLKGANEKLKEDISLKEKLVANLEIELSALRMELKMKTERLMVLEEQHISWSLDLERIEELTKERQKLDSMAFNWMNRAKFLDTEVERLLHLIATSKEEFNLLSIKHEDVVGYMESLQSQIAGLTSRILRLEEEKAELQRLSSELQTDKKELCEKLIIGEVHVLELQKQVNASRERESWCKQSLDDANKQIGGLLSDVQKLGLAMAEKVEKELKLMEELERLKTSEAASEQFNELQIALSIDKAEISMLREEIAFKNRHVSKLEVEISVLKHDRDNLSEELLLARQEEASLEAELAHVREVEKQLRHHLQEVELKDRIIMDQSCIVSQKFEAASREVETLRMQISELLDENSRLADDVMKRILSVADMAEIVSGMKKRHSDMEVQLRMRHEQSTILQEQIVRLQQQNDELKHASSSGEREMFALKKEISKLQQLEEMLQFCFQEIENSSPVSKLPDFEGVIAQDLKGNRPVSFKIVSLIGEHNRRLNDLQGQVTLMMSEIESGSEQLKERNKELKRLCEETRELGGELHEKILAFSSIEPAATGARKELILLMGKNKELCEEILQLRSECAHLGAERDSLNHDILLSNEDNQRLLIEISRMQQAIEELRSTLRVKEELISLLENKVESLTETKTMVVDDTCDDLHILCENLSKEMMEGKQKRVLSGPEKSLKGTLERTRSLEHVLSLKESGFECLEAYPMRLKEEVTNLQEQLNTLQKENRAIHTELSVKSSLVHELEVKLTGIQETKVVFDDDMVFAMGDTYKIQEEVIKLLERVHSLSKREKSYVATMRFLRAVCAAWIWQIKAWKEKETLMEAERRRNEELLADFSSLQHEFAILKEENDMQRDVIFDMGGEKREAIRQLCLALEYWQDESKRLEGIISSTREKIQRRMQAISVLQ